MSDPSADVSSGRGVGAVLGVVFGAALIIACVVFVLRQSAGGIDGNARMRAAFDLGTLPYELEVLQAAQLFQGEESVVLADPRAEPEPPKTPPPEDDESEKSENDESKPPEQAEQKPRFDWSKIAMSETRPPRQVSLMWYPPAVGDDRIKQQFGAAFHMAMRDIGEEGGLAEMESGTLVWGQYAPAFVHERLFEAGRTFRDTLRVNLSTPGQYCVMVVAWPRNSPGSKTQVDEILKALAPKPIEDAPR